jgi:prepilin peptidase CpaA
MSMTDPSLLHAFLLFAAAMALLFAAAHDVAVRTVPNAVSAVVAAAGLAVNAWDGQLAPALFGAVLVFAAAWYCWRRGWFGGGDVKLLTACVLLVPPGSVPALILCTALAGGAMALFYVSLARMLPRRPSPRPTGLLARIWRAERRRIRRGLSLPYSCAIAAGALLTLASPLHFG